MDKRLIASQYDEIKKNINTLSQDIQHLENECDLIGTLSDTHEFRKPLTKKMNSIQSLIMKIRNKLQNAEDNGLYNQQKWRSLKQEYLRIFERLNRISSLISNKMHKNKMRGSISEQNDNNQLLVNNTNKGYGSTNQQQQQQQQQQQEMFVEYHAEIYEMENFEEEVYKIVENLQQLYQAQRDLNDLVYEMDEPIQMLVDNTGDALDNVQAGVVNIEKAAKHLKSYRGKMCCMIGALLLIAIIVTIIVVVSNSGKKK